MTVTNEQIKTELSIIKAIIESRIDQIEKDVRSVTDKTNEIDKTLRGNGTKGIKERVSNVEDFVKGSKYFYNAVILAVLLDIVLRIVPFK